MAKKMCDKKKKYQATAGEFTCRKCGISSDKKRQLCKPDKK